MKEFFRILFCAFYASSVLYAFAASGAEDIREALEQGEALYARGQAAEAVQALRYAYTRSPEDRRVRAGLALALEESGARQEALMLWLSLDAEEASTNPEYLYYLGRHYLMQGRFDLAHKTLVRFSVKNEAAPASGSKLAVARAAALLLAVSQHLAGRHAEAIANIAYLQEELSANSSFAQALAGAAHAALNQWAPAIDFFRAALKRDSNLADFRRMLAQAHAKTGDNDNAYIEGRRYLSAEEDEDFNRSFKRYAAHTSKPVEMLLKTQESGFAMAWPKAVDFQIPGARGRNLEIGMFASSTGEIPALSELLVSGSASFLLRLADGSLVERGKPEEPWKILYLSEPAPMAAILRGSREVIRSVEGFTLSPESLGSFLIKNARTVGEPLVLKSDLQVRGALRVIPGPSGLSVINEITLEDYLLGVLPAEIGPDSPPETFKAQAVLARSYALWRLSEPDSHRFFDSSAVRPVKLCDSVHCQAYKGYLVENAPAREAVKATAGQVLHQKGKPFRIWYHASCGGLLRDIPAWDASGDVKRMLLPSTLPPLGLSQFLELSPFWDESPEWCFEKNSRFGWVRLISMEDLRRKTRERFPKIGALKDVRVMERSEDGRVIRVRLTGSKGFTEISEEFPIRQALAPGALRSTLFSMIPIGRKGKLEHLLFIGRGFGHGRGMCQVGAINQGKKGRAYKEILKSYYPGSELVNER